MSVMNLLTVDLEDWFHICEVEHLLPREKWDKFPSTVVTDTEKLLSLVAQTNSRATFFVLGYVAEKHPELVRRIYHMGHEIGYHGWDHELVYELSPQDFRQILRRGIECIERLIDKRPIGFRAPQWSINNRSRWALEILAEEFKDNIVCERILKEFVVQHVYMHYVRYKDKQRISGILNIPLVTQLSIQSMQEMKE